MTPSPVVPFFLGHLRGSKMGKVKGPAWDELAPYEQDDIRDRSLRDRRNGKLPDPADFPAALFELAETAHGKPEAREGDTGAGGDGGDRPGRAKAGRGQYRQSSLC
jgi:hypothetical protein